MAPPGATRRLVTPGLDPTAPTTGIPFSLFFLLMMLPYIYSLPSRTERLISEKDQYYMVDGTDIRCLLCPAGTFVKNACSVQDTRGTCEKCAEGTYLEYPSGLSECLSCSRCRDDQEEVSFCNITKNTVCHCKRGTFCLPGQPCEICTPCATSCPEGQVVNTPCNTSSNMLCAAPTASNATSIIIACITTPVLLIILFFAIYYFCVCQKKKETDKGSKLFGKLTVHICKGNENCHEASDELLDRRLQIQEGTDEDTKEEIISKSCAIIVRWVPIREFESVMQSLGVSHNEIERAKMDNQQNANNQFTAMLQSWYQKKDFDINILLQALRTLSMEKAARNIAEQLIKDGLYVQQTLPNTQSC